MEQKRPPLLEGFEVEDTICQGAGGVFYRVFRRQDNVGRGRKFLLYRSDSRGALGDPIFDQALASAEVSQAISHPNLLSLHGVQVADHHLCLLSEWMPGVSLRSLMESVLSQGDRCAVEVALTIVKEVAQGLAHLQLFTHAVSGERAGIRHGQVRPENIFVSRGGKVKLLGPCVAGLERQALAGNGGFRAGLPNYASPEEASAQPVDERGDFFSLGALLWELLAGGPLYEAKDKEAWLKKLGGKALPPSQMNPDVPPEADAIAVKLLEPDIYQRYQLADELIADLTRVLKEYNPGYAFTDFLEFCRENIDAPVEAEKRERSQLTQTAATATIATATIATTANSATTATNAATSTVATATIAAPAQSEAATSTNIQVAQLAEERSAWNPEASRNTGRILRMKSQVAMFANRPEESGGQLLSLFSLKTALGFLMVILILAPFYGDKILKKARSLSGKEAARSTASLPKTASLRFWSNEPDFMFVVNDIPVAVENDRADVPAGVKLQIFLSKPGFEDIYLERTYTGGEVENLEIEFKRILN